MAVDDAQASEQTPLLAAAAAAAPDNQPREDGVAPAPTPLPKLAIFVLTFTRVADSLAFAILFPFVNSQVLATGQTSVEQVGYYVGLIESLFSVTQMVTRAYQALPLVLPSG
jgi:hypothetical protein